MGPRAIDWKTMKAHHEWGHGTDLALRHWMRGRPRPTEPTAEALYVVSAKVVLSVEIFGVRVNFIDDLGSP
ncbi:MAG: hypothetical protein QGG05_15985, partial [Candidatus Latescibacteria bacterium]|nr:hypothetical protein [Candidatus Latescibacterota bacterium]